MRTLQSAGFTPRQAGFLVLVLEHSGVCLPRQYRAFSGIAHGQETHRFFAKLIAGGFALRLVSARVPLAQHRAGSAPHRASPRAVAARSTRPSDAHADVQHGQRLRSAQSGQAA
jgi:hypothetical protein